MKSTANLRVWIRDLHAWDSDVCSERRSPAIHSCFLKRISLLSFAETGVLFGPFVCWLPWYTNLRAAWCSERIFALKNFHPWFLGLSIGLHESKNENDLASDTMPASHSRVPPIFELLTESMDSCPLLEKYLVCYFPGWIRDIFHFPGATFWQCSLDGCGRQIIAIRKTWLNPKVSYT